MESDASITYAAGKVLGHAQGDEGRLCVHPWLEPDNQSTFLDELGWEVPRGAAVGKVNVARGVKAFRVNIALAATLCNVAKGRGWGGNLCRHRSTAWHNACALQENTAAPYRAGGNRCPVLQGTRSHPYCCRYFEPFVSA